MIRSATISLLGVISAFPAMSQELARPAFEFKGQRFDQPVDMALPEFKLCRPAGAAELSCRAYAAIIGTFATLDYKIYRGKAYYLSVTIPRSAYGQAVAAFSTKYGKPCEIAQMPWQNALGMSQPNTLTMYCMRTGKLVAFAIGEQVDQARAVYIDDANAPPDAPRKVDF